jgi:molybdopterin adenylyltransferase
VPIRVGLLTVSDAGARGEREDTSGDQIAEWVANRGDQLVVRELVPDEVSRIVPTLIRWIDSA